MKSKAVYSILTIFASTMIMRAEDVKSAPQKITPVVVKGTAIGAELNPTSPSLILSGNALEVLPQSNLGDVLADLPGVSTSYFGPNSSRPAIRGLEGDRLKITQNGTSTLDASSASPDHAVSVDPASIREIQILRGPAALIYSPSILGGVINLIDNRIPVELLPQQFIINSRFGSVDQLSMQSVSAEGSFGSFAFHVDAFQKKTDDLSTPIGVITDTSSDSDGAGLGFSYIKNDSFIGLSYSGLNSTYGVTEPDVKIGLRQRRWELAGGISSPSDNFKSINYKASTTDYVHTEFESGQPGSTFKNNGFDSRIDFELAKSGSLEGLVGLQMGKFDFSVVGDEAFLPDTRNTSSAAFGSFVQELSDSSLRLRYGFRIESAKVKSSDWVHEGVHGSYAASQASFVPQSFSLAIEKAINAQWVSTLTLSTTERAPNYQELFADGPHIGTDSYEVGNRNLDKEKGIGIELEIAKSQGPISTSFSIFYNRFSSFIIQERNGYGPLTSSADYQLGGTEELARYDFVSVPADFYGSEIKMNFQIQETPTTNLGLELFGDYVRATHRDSSEALPRISPGRVGLGLHGLSQEWNWRFDYTYHLPQNHVANDETTTAGYTMAGASVTKLFKLSACDALFTLRLANLLNREAYNHSSFIKTQLPLPGRSVEAGLKLTF